MPYVRTTGLWFPERYTTNGVAAFANIGPIVATGDKVGFIGRVWTPDRGSKNISKVGFRFGSALVKAGGSALTLSLQDVDLANGPPYRWDGTQDQTVAIPNASMVSSTWLTTNPLSATRTVAHGDRLAVVVEYDGAGRLGADSVSIVGFTTGSNLPFPETGCVSLLSAAYTAVAGMTNVVFEFDDGTFGGLDNGMAASAVGSDAYNSGSGTNNIGMQFTAPMNCKVDGAWALLQAAANADFDFNLYSISGSTLTLLATSTLDANASRAAATVYFHETIFPEQTLAAGAPYFLSIKPSTANNVTLYNYSTNSNGYLGVMGGGASWQYNTASGATLGSATNTKRPFMGLRISALDDGAGGGGGLLVNPGMRGGMN